VLEEQCNISLYLRKHLVAQFYWWIYWRLFGFTPIAQFRNAFTRKIDLSEPLWGMTGRLNFDIISQVKKVVYSRLSMKLGTLIGEL
jgi:hypothetical protein